MCADPWNPPMFLGLDSGSVSYMYVGVVCCWFMPRSKSFSTGTLVFLPPKKPTFCKFWNSTWIIFLPKCWSWFNIVSNFILDIAQIQITEDWVSFGTFDCLLSEIWLVIPCQKDTSVEYWPGMKSRWLDTGHDKLFYGPT